MTGTLWKMDLASTIYDFTDGRKMTPGNSMGFLAQTEYSFMIQTKPDLQIAISRNAGFHVLSGSASRNKVLFTLLAVLFSVGCSVNPRPNSPDVKYSRNSEAAQKLQVPPDLTDISRGEQFVLPGDSGGVVARNTLLPGFESLRYVRNGSESWIESQARPEALWPRLLAFLSAEDYEVSRTQPVNGLIETQWRNIGGDAGTLKSLVTSDTGKVQRVGIRIERLPGGGSRLFIRHQNATDNPGDGALWGSDSVGSPQSADVTQRLLVFLGIDEQRAKGLLREPTAALLEPAVLQSTTAGANLLLHYGYLPGYQAVEFASVTLGLKVTESDASTGRVVVVDGNGLVGEKGATYLLELKPLHVSAVSVSAADSGGRRLDGQLERSLLQAIRDTLT